MPQNLHKKLWCRSQHKMVPAECATGRHAQSHCAGNSFSPRTKEVSRQRTKVIHSGLFAMEAALDKLFSLCLSQLCVFLRQLNSISIMKTQWEFLRQCALKHSKNHPYSSPDSHYPQQKITIHYYQSHGAAEDNLHCGRGAGIFTAWASKGDSSHMASSDVWMQHFAFSRATVTF